MTACAACTEPMVDLLDSAWAISPSVALRPEPFGALAYHFGNRKLTFLKRRDLVTVVESLGEHITARSALRAAGIPEAQFDVYASALGGLAAADMITPRKAAS